MASYGVAPTDIFFKRSLGELMVARYAVHSSDIPTENVLSVT